MLQEIEDKENSENDSINAGDNVRDYISKEKAELKDLQLRLEDDKKRYKEDKREAESLRHADPSTYRQRCQVLDKVKESIERQIDKLNVRIAKVKEIERGHK
jgi:hypothetical protein